MLNRNLLVIADYRVTGGIRCHYVDDDESDKIAKEIVTYSHQMIGSGMYIVRHDHNTVFSKYTSCYYCRASDNKYNTCCNGFENHPYYRTLYTKLMRGDDNNYYNNDNRKYITRLYYDADLLKLLKSDHNNGINNEDICNILSTLKAQTTYPVDYEFWRIFCRDQFIRHLLFYSPDLNKYKLHGWEYKNDLPSKIKYNGPSKIDNMYISSNSDIVATAIRFCFGSSIENTIRTVNKFRQIKCKKFGSKQIFNIHKIPMIYIDSEGKETIVQSKKGFKTIKCSLEITSQEIIYYVKERNKLASDPNKLQLTHQ